MVVSTGRSSGNQQPLPESAPGTAADTVPIRNPQARPSSGSGQRDPTREGHRTSPDLIDSNGVAAVPDPYPIRSETMQRPIASKRPKPNSGQISPANLRSHQAAAPATPQPTWEELLGQR